MRYLLPILFLLFRILMLLNLQINYSLIYRCSRIFRLKCMKSTYFAGGIKWFNRHFFGVKSQFSMTRQCLRIFDNLSKFFHSQTPKKSQVDRKVAGLEFTVLFFESTIYLIDRANSLQIRQNSHFTTKMTRLPLQL